MGNSEGGDIGKRCFQPSVIPQGQKGEVFRCLAVEDQTSLVKLQGRREMRAEDSRGSVACQAVKEGWSDAVKDQLLAERKLVVKETFFVAFK